jgi:F-type H+-transporting ATPase subunit epsilon
MTLDMKLKVISASRKLFDGEVNEVAVPGGKGDMVILPGHTSLLSTLSLGEVVFESESQTSRIVIDGGLVQVENDEVLVLADEAVAVDDIVLEEIEEAEKQAHERIRDEQLSSSDLIQAEKALRYERLKKDAATKYRK